jgi:hypothetical protein
MRRFSVRLVLTALLALASTLGVHAKSKFDDAIRKRAESSLLVTGDIDITAEGKVVGYRLDSKEKLPAGIVELIARVAPQWTFEPVSMPSSVGRSRMSLLFVAKKLDNGDFRVELRDANFDVGLPPEQRLTIAQRGRMPEYPRDLNAMGVTGTVFLLVEIGRDGKVANIDASRVHLRTIGNEQEMAQWRDALAETSIRAIRHWRFAPPTAGTGAAASKWTGTLPVSFTFDASDKPRPGKWQTYLPGPRKHIPWFDGVNTAEESGDALVPDQFHMSGQGRRLTSPLMGG